MKQLSLTTSAILLLVLTLVLPGCEVVGDIFQAGVWVGVIVVAAIVGLIIWLIGKARK